MRGLLAQNEMNESLSPDLVSVLTPGDVGPLGRSGLSADAAMDNAHESGTCLCAGHATDALGGTSSSAHSGCFETILVCSV